MYFLIFTLLTFIVQINAIGICYHPGPSFPPVHHILNSTHFTHLSTTLTTLLSHLKLTPENWSPINTSFAIQLTTASETIWDSYHTAPILGEYKDSDPTPVDGDTAFRIASISKSFTVYAILLEKGIGLEDPITKFLPELVRGEGEREVWDVDWEEISIRSLASQLSGIARETGLGELSMDFENLPDPVGSGFPPVDEEFLAPCMKNMKDKPCNASEIVRTAMSRHKIFSPNDRSTYSNVAFSLLGMVLERVADRSYSEVISSSILYPLGMSNTRTSKPKDSAGIIPFGPNDWALDLDADTPSGGLYSTPNDFSKYLRSILSSTLLPQNTTNAWMKPYSWTSSGTHSAYGMPWEILRTTKGTPDGRGIDIITKGGSLTGYFSTIALLPEFGLGLTILVAGAQPALHDLLERISAELISSVDKLLRDEVRRTYCGLWADWDEWFGPPNMNYSLRIEVDDTGPGLLIRDWKSNGTDFLPVYGKLKGMPSDLDQWEARLLTTGIRWPLDDEQGEMESWRLTAIPKRVPGSEARIWDDYCMTDVDTLMYGGWSIEDFSIVKDDMEPGGNYQAIMLSNSGLRNLLFKWTDCEGKDLGLSQRNRKATGGKVGFGSSSEQRPIFG